MNEPDFAVGATLRARELRVRARSRAETRLEGDLELTRETRSLPEAERKHAKHREAEVGKRLEGRLRKPD